IIVATARGPARGAGPPPNTAVRSHGQTAYDAGMKPKKSVPRRRAPTTKARPDEPPELPAPRNALPAPSPEPAGEHEPVTPLATPELAFAARVPPPTEAQPLPANQRAIFYDVENASQPRRSAQVIELLAIDRLGLRTEFVAVGDWRE